jgi:hypothetical protein
LKDDQILQINEGITRCIIKIKNKEVIAIHQFVEAYTFITSFVNQVNENYKIVAFPVINECCIIVGNESITDFGKDEIVIGICEEATKDPATLRWALIHECAHALAIKMKKIFTHNKLFYRIFFELMDDLYLSDSFARKIMQLEQNYKPHSSKYFHFYLFTRDKIIGHADRRMNNESISRILPEISAV